MGSGVRYAIFSDIHGNLPAWQKVLEDIRSLEADVLICLGDMVGYGPKPQEVLDEIRAATDYFVLGNHDAAAAGIMDPSIFNEEAHAIVLWTRDHLNRESLEFLRTLPLELATDSLLFVHAEVSQPGRFNYIDNAEIAAENFAVKNHFATFIGHTHHPLVYERTATGEVNTYQDEDRSLDRNCRYIINVGSAGDPRNPDDIRASYVIYDDDTKKVYFRRIHFDPEVYRRDLASTSLTHTPYFLKVLDHKETLEAAQLHAMEVPVRDVTEAVTVQRRLVFSEPTSITAKPKPLPLKSSQKSSSKPAMMVMGALLLCVGIGCWALSARPTPATDLSETPKTSQPVDLPARPSAPAPTDQLAPAKDTPAKMVVKKEPPPVSEVRTNNPTTGTLSNTARPSTSSTTSSNKEGNALTPGGVVTNSGMAERRLLFAINDGQFDFSDPYTIDNSANISPESFDRVGYYVELDDDWVWVSMDRFQRDPKLLGVPQMNSGIVENGTLVKNLVIDSNRDDLKALNRPDLSGIIEFWANNYHPNGEGAFGSSDTHFDWKDKYSPDDGNYGSFQIFAFKNDRQTEANVIFGITNRGGMGIGNQEPHTFNAGDEKWISTDWTLVPRNYPKPQKRNLEIWVGRSN